MSETIQINGWTIEMLPEGWEFQYRVYRGDWEIKTYSRDAAERFARENPERMAGTLPVGYLNHADLT